MGFLPRTGNPSVTGGVNQTEIIRRRVCSLFARLPRYHPSAPGTTRHEFETKSARNGTD